MRKKVLAIGIVVIMLVTILPTNAFAYGKSGLSFSVNRLSGMALKNDGTVRTWGNYHYGQLGVPAEEGNYIVEGEFMGRSGYLVNPTQILNDVVSVWSTGTTTNVKAFAIKSDNSLWGWGDGYTGGGPGPTAKANEQNKPYIIMENVAYVVSNNMAVTLDGSLWAWGLEDNNKVATSFYVDNIKHVKLMDNVAFASSAQSGAELVTLAVKTDGTLWAWGYNRLGQLGDGTTDYRETPVKIMDGVAYAVTDYNVSMAIKTDGSLWSWGNIPRASGEEYHKPTHIMDNVDKVMIEDGYKAIKTDGSLWAWGNKNSAGVGDGTEQTYYSPVKIMDNVADVAEGSWHTIVLKKDGSVWAWGNNDYGQVGDGTTQKRLSPVWVMDGVAAISADGHTTMALKNDGSLWAWGQNESGEIGDGTRDNRHSPVKIMDSVMLPSSTPPISTPVSETPSSWAVELVDTAITAGLVPEALQSKYTQATTRAEFCALAVALYKTVTGVEITERSTFTDTKDVNVEKAAAIGVVSGVGDNKFSPDTQLTREQAAVMLARLADAVGKPLAKQAATFADNGNISSWAIEQVGQIQAAGIMSGVGDNTFSPSTDYTREQSIITIMRLFDLVK